VSATLLTLGYEGRTLEEFVRLLRAEGASAVLDARDVPWSHKPGFAKKPLQSGLEAAGIAYVHAGFAGNPKRLRASAADTAEALRLYAEHLDASPDVLDELERVVADLHDQGKRVCLVCLESDPAQCHRAILAERWAARGTERSVRHLRFASRRSKKS
jgi:uncharacterized protein (DUF488 family)